MKNLLKSCVSYHTSSLGFTFIELIVVFTVTTIIGTIGIASLASYNHSQEVATAALDLKTLIQHARSLAVSQVKPSSCPTDLSNPNNNSSLLGYEVDFCAGNKDNQGNVLTPPPACHVPSNQNGDYEVNAKCSNGIGYVLVSSKKYSSQLQITSDAGSYFFPVVTAGVSSSGTIKVSGYGVNRNITISSIGVIQ